MDQKSRASSSRRFFACSVKTCFHTDGQRQTGTRPDHFWLRSIKNGQQAHCRTHSSSSCSLRSPTASTATSPANVHPTPTATPTPPTTAAATATAVATTITTTTTNSEREGDGGAMKGHFLQKLSKGLF